MAAVAAAHQEPYTNTHIHTTVFASSAVLHPFLRER